MQKEALLSFDIMGCNQSKINKAVVQQNNKHHPNINQERNSSLLPNSTSILQEEEEQQLLGKNNSNRSSSINNVDSSRNEAVVGSVRRNTVPSIDKRNNSDLDANKKQQRHSYASSGGSTSPGYVSKTSDVSFNSVNAVQSSPGKVNDNTDNIDERDKGIKENEVGKGKKKTAWSGKHKLRDTTSSSTSKQKDESSTHSTTPPSPLPTLANTTDSAANAVNDPHWISIYQKLSPQIIDPEDLSTIISSIISTQIDKLSPAEVSFIKRRVKYSLGFVVNNEGGENGDQGSSYGGSNSEGREGKEQMPKRKSTLSKVSKKLGLNSSSNNLPSKSNSLSSDSMHPALDESSDRQKTTKQIYKQEHTLDISTIRKIFENGDTCIKKLKRNVKEELVLFGMENSSSASASGSAGGSERLERKNSTGRSSSTPRSSPTNNEHQTITTIQPKTTQQDNVDEISQVDIYGSTFLLLLHLSDNRFEYITELAKVSAKDANLILDVNKLCLLEEDKNKNGKEKKKIPPPPPTLALNPNITPPSTPNYGISFTSICYLISLSKFGTRIQKLQLLFYSLLPPKLLNDVLNNHPGNIPTWLLECDNDLIVSYDSLCYYYEYDGVLLPNGDDASMNVDGEEAVKRKKKLCIDAYSSVEVMASLVADSLNGSGKVQQQSNNDEGTTTTAYGTRQLMISLLEMEDDNDTTTHDVKEDVKCLEVHTMLQEEATSSSTTSHLNLSQSEIHDISKFAELAAALPLTNTHINGTTNTANNTTNNTTNDNNNTRLKWSLQEFIQWSNKSLNETTLNIIMNKLFTIGILPTATMECELVDSRWIDWNMLQDNHEYKKLSSLKKNGKEKVNEDAGSEGKVSSDGGDSAGQSTTTPASSRGGLRNLFTSNDTVSTSTDQPSLTSDNGVTTTTAITQVGDYNRVWGGIGGADGKGGLGQGVLYCIDKIWWDEWVAYTGFNLDSSSTNGRSRRKRSLKRPRELSTERLIDRSPDSPFVSGSRGSYEMMKHRLVRDKDYVLIPPGVWNVLYEMYGGGPPLPRMVLPRSRLSVQNGSALDDERGLVSTHNTDESVEVTSSQHERSVRSNNAKQYPQAIPSSVRVATHSWLLHCQICDPQQPY